MNNDYDRESAPTEKTHQEMLDDGYYMTGDGVWMPGPEDETSTVVDITEDSTPAVKMLSFRTGEVVITELSETLYSDTYVLSNPRVVFIDSTGESSTTVSFSDWMPLANTRKFTVNKDYIVCVTEPLDSLVDSYLANRNG